MFFPAVYIIICFCSLFFFLFFFFFLFVFLLFLFFFFFFSSRRRHTRSLRDWSSDVCSSDLGRVSLKSPKHEVIGRPIRRIRCRSSIRHDVCRTALRFSDDCLTMVCLVKDRKSVV